MLNLSAHENDVPPALANRRDWKYFDQERKDVAQWRRERRGQVEIDGEEIKRQTTAEQLKAAKAEIERLKAKLEHAGGSLFDLANDTAEVIGKILADNMSEGRFDTAVKAAKARHKAKRQKPAG
jgi:hypothetical protein